MGGRKDQNSRSLFQSIPSAISGWFGSAADIAVGARLGPALTMVANSTAQGIRPLITQSLDCQSDLLVQVYATTVADASEMREQPPDVRPGHVQWKERTLLSQRPAHVRHRQ